MKNYFIRESAGHRINAKVYGHYNKLQIIYYILLFCSILDNLSLQKKKKGGGGGALR